MVNNDIYIIAPLVGGNPTDIHRYKNFMDICYISIDKLSKMYNTKVQVYSANNINIPLIEEKKDQIYEFEYILFIIPAEHYSKFSNIITYGIQKNKKIYVLLLNNDFSSAVGIVINGYSDVHIDGNTKYIDTFDRFNRFISCSDSKE